MYDKIINAGNYTFSMEVQDSEINYKVSMAQKGVDTCIDMYSNDEHTSTLVLDGKVYYIMHNEQEYYNYDIEDIDADVILEGLKKLTELEHVTGREEINGKSYYYEEYEDITDFFIFLGESEEAEVKTRFYFDNNNIVYIKNIEIIEGNAEEELIKANLEYNVQEDLFTIPEEYAEM